MLEVEAAVAVVPAARVQRVSGATVSLSSASRGEQRLIVERRTAHNLLSISSSAALVNARQSNDAHNEWPVPAELVSHSNEADTRMRQKAEPGQRSGDSAAAGLLACSL